MPDQPFSVDRPLPEGVRDLLFADAATLRGMAASLRATWNAWGYREIILPTFEYAATLSTDVGAGSTRRCTASSTATAAPWLSAPT